MGGYNPLSGHDPKPSPPGFKNAKPTGHPPALPPMVNLYITRASKRPWSNDWTASDTLIFTNITMSTKSKLSDLMGVLGLTSHIPTKDLLIEITESTSGRWRKGMSYCALDGHQGKELRELGWDETRTGNPGERPSIFLWACKDYD